SSDKEYEGVYVASVDSDDHRLLVPVRSRAEYANGRLFFCSNQGILISQPFDLGQLRLTGEAVRVTEGVGHSAQEGSNFAFSVAGENIAYWSGQNFPITQLTWLDRKGGPIGAIGEPGYFYGFMMSPDGKSIAIERLDYLQANSADIWLLDSA